MAAIDFITALGRVLQDGTLRDAFAADPLALVQQLDLRERDQSLFLQLVPADLEFQARVLLRKRFALVAPALPRTCARMGGAAWPEFQRYGRTHRPPGQNQPSQDAFEFCQHMLRFFPQSVCPLELNRVRFAQGQRQFAIHFVMAMPVRRCRRPGVQFFLRHRSGCWREWLFYLGG